MFDPNEFERENAEGEEMDAIFILQDGKLTRMEVPDDDDDQA